MTDMTERISYSSKNNLNNPRNTDIPLRTFQEHSGTKVELFETKMFCTSRATLLGNKIDVIRQILEQPDYAGKQSELLKNVDLLFENQSLFSACTGNIPHGAQIALLELVKSNPDTSYEQIRNDPTSLGTVLHEELKKLIEKSQDNVEDKQKLEKISNNLNDNNLENYFQVAIRTAQTNTYSSSWFTQYQDLNNVKQQSGGKPVEQIQQHPPVEQQMQMFLAQHLLAKVPAQEKIPQPIQQPFKYPLKFKQGKTGDCYLLSALLVMSELVGGPQRLNEMFSTTSGGEVNCRLKLSHNVELYNEIKKGWSKSGVTDRLGVKGYKFDFDDNTHTLTVGLTSAKAKKIRDNPKLSTTEDYNIKYLETIIAKVMEIKQGKETQLNSRILQYPHDNNQTIAFHNGNNREETLIFSLLGLSVESEFTIGKVVPRDGKPIYPCYFSIDVKDETGKIRGRHAYMLKRIELGGTTLKDIRLVIVNPHDSSEPEERKLTDIAELNPKFKIFTLES